MHSRPCFFLLSLPPTYFISFHSPHVLLARCVRAHPGFSAAATHSRFSPFLPTTSTALGYKYPFQIPLLSRSKDLDFPCTYYYVTPSQDHSTGCPTHMTFYPPHPPPPHPTLPFPPTTGTVLGFEYPFKILTS